MRAYCASIALVALAVAGCGDPYRQGMMAFEQGRWQEAVQNLERVSATDTDHFFEARDSLQVAYFNAGQQAHDENNREAAVQFLKHVKKGDPNFEKAEDLMGCIFYDRAQEAFEAGDFSEAVRLCNIVRTNCRRYEAARQLTKVAREKMAKPQSPEAG